MDLFNYQLCDFEEILNHIFSWEIRAWQTLLAVFKLLLSLGFKVKVLVGLCPTSAPLFLAGSILASWPSTIGHNEPLLPQVTPSSHFLLALLKCSSPGYPHFLHLHFLQVSAQISPP